MFLETLDTDKMPHRRSFISRFLVFNSCRTAFLHILSLSARLKSWVDAAATSQDEVQNAACSSSGSAHRNYLKSVLTSTWCLLHVTEPNLPPQVSGRMQHLKEDLFEKVSAVLESPNNGPNGQAALRAALAGRWQAALDKAARFWARHRDSSNAERAEMEAPLQELHEYIHATIDAEVPPTPLPHLGPPTICFNDCIA